MPIPNRINLWHCAKFVHSSWYADVFSPASMLFYVHFTKQLAAFNQLGDLSYVFFSWQIMLPQIISCKGLTVEQYTRHIYEFPWWRHQMETFSALLAICAGSSPVPSEFPHKWPVTRSFDVFFDLRLNKRLSKQSWGWWFETLSCPLWRHCNAIRLCDLNFGKLPNRKLSEIHYRLLNTERPQWSTTRLRLDIRN